MRIHTGNMCDINIYIYSILILILHACKENVYTVDTIISTGTRYRDRMILRLKIIKETLAGSPANHFREMGCFFRPGRLT